MAEKKPVYEVEVIASVNCGNTYTAITVLTLDDCYQDNNYTPLEPVGYINDKSIVEEK